MSWYICFLIAIIIFIRIAFILVRNNSRFKSVRIFIDVILASYFMYIPVFSIEFSESNAIIGSILNIMRMISLDASYLDYYEVVYSSIGIEFVSNLYMIILGLLHILIPVFAILTAYDCIVNFLSFMRIELINLRGSDVYIFSEMNDYSINLALDISEKLGCKAEYIFANVSEGYKNRNSLFSKLNYCTMTSDTIDNIDLKIKSKKKIYFLNISENNDENINMTLKLANKYINLPKDKQKQIDIFLFSDSPETDTIVDSMTKGVLGIHLLNPDRLSVYKLFDEHPLYEEIKDDSISLLICGMDNIGVEVLKSALWLGQLANTKLEINVVALNATEKKKQLQLMFPEIFSDEYNVSFYDTDLQDISFKETLINYCINTTYAVICGNDDEENLSTALYLRRFFLKQDLSVKNMPIIAAYINDNEKAKVITNLKTAESKEERRINYQITPFGGVNSVYTYNLLMNSPVEMLSMNVHLAYEEIFSDSKEINVLEAMERYNMFEVNKKSNRANALHIRYKLWMLGLDYTDDKDVCEVDLDEYLTDDIMKKLTVAEHDRWMAFLRTEGWESATIQDVNNYKSTNLSQGRHNCPFLQMHPYLCDFNRLVNISDSLGLPDATAYDRELIRMIPKILNNKAINNCNFKIIRREN